MLSLETVDSRVSNGEIYPNLDLYVQDRLKILALTFAVHVLLRKKSIVIVIRLKFTFLHLYV